MDVDSVVGIDARRIAELTATELAQLNERTPRSAAMFERARKSLSGGVASSYQLRDPWPIYLASGARDTAVNATSWLTRCTTEPEKPSAIAEQDGQPAL